MTGPRVIEGTTSASGLRLAVVAARFNAFIVDRLVEGARAAWREAGGADQDLTLVRCPGSFELPLVAQRLAESGRVDAVACLGCVVRGATAHFDYVAGQAARGVLDAGLSTGVPIVFGVLTTDTIEQAIERADKGRDAVLAAVEMATLLSRLDEGTEDPGRSG